MITLKKYNVLGKAAVLPPFSFLEGKKGQSVNFPMILLIGFFGMVTLWGLLSGVQGAMSGVLSMTEASAELKFVLLLVPFVLVFSIIFWTVYFVRGGTGG